MLFSCSVRDNIAYGSLDPTTITDAEIIEAARKANAYNFINSFPHPMSVTKILLCGRPVGD
jgi:ABC-type multidrug transport system fused ATPase/permease subunit